MPAQAILTRSGHDGVDVGMGPGEQLGEVHRTRDAGEFALAVKKEQRRVAHDL